MMTFLAIVHIIACLGLISLVLVQDSKGGGVFTSQASSNSVLGAGGATSLAQTMTKALAAVFALTCIGLSIMSARSQKSVIDTLPAQTQQIPTTTSVPATGTPPGTSVPADATATANAAAPTQQTAQPAAVTPTAPAQPVEKK